MHPMPACRQTGERSTAELLPGLFKNRAPTFVVGAGLLPVCLKIIPNLLVSNNNCKICYYICVDDSNHQSEVR